MKTLSKIIVVGALTGCSTLSARCEDAKPISDAVSQERQAIQAIYDSPLYRSGTEKKFHSLHWPSSHKVDEKSFRWLRTIRKFSLQEGKAQVVVEYHDSVSATDPKTGKAVLFEAIDTNEDMWVKEKGQWVSNQSKRLSSEYLMDGVSPYFPWLKFPAKSSRYKSRQVADKGEGAKPIYTLTAKITVDQKIWEQKDLKNMSLGFHCTNGGESIVNLDPIYRSSRLFINDKEESNWRFIAMNGLRSTQFSALPAGKTDGFGCYLGSYFKTAGRYKIRWESSSFEPVEVEFTVKP